MSDLFVKKFGGTSVGSTERIDWVADLLADAFQSGERFVVVASAMSGETNRLVRMAHEMNSGYRGPAYDMLLASGEQVSISLLAMALQKRGLKAKPYLAYQLGIKTDSVFSKARIQNIDTEALEKDLKEGIIPIAAGFQGLDVQQQITTLGRGGSDTTAVALAAALKADACQIYTDVNGVYTADPRIAPKAKKIDQLSYDEMMEMAALGSKVLHFRCVEIAAKYDVPVCVLSTFEAKNKTSNGTWIKKETNPMEAPVVSAVTHDAKVVVLQAEPIPQGVDFLAKLFKSLSDQEVVVDIISQAQGSKGPRVAFSIADEDAGRGEQILKELAGPEATISTFENVAKVSIVGVGMRSHPGVAARFFNVLSREGVDLKLITTSDIKMSGVIPRGAVENFVQKLHTEFGLDQ